MSTGLFVSHNADAAAQADAQIQVRDGSARLVMPPFADGKEIAA